MKNRKDIRLRTGEPYPLLVAGGPPYPPYATDGTKHGLSILDWFAGHAAAGLAANEVVVRTTSLTAEEAKALAETAYTIAAYLVDVRSEVPVEPTPVPGTPPEESGMKPVMPPENLP